jgi:hypothetical protein
MGTWYIHTLGTISRSIEISTFAMRLLQGRLAFPIVSIFHSVEDGPYGDMGG